MGGRPAAWAGSRRRASIRPRTSAPWVTAALCSPRMTTLAMHAPPAAQLRPGRSATEQLWTSGSTAGSMSCTPRCCATRCCHDSTGGWRAARRSPHATSTELVDSGSAPVRPTGGASANHLFPVLRARGGGPRGKAGGPGRGGRQRWTALSDALPGTAGSRGHRCDRRLAPGRPLRIAERELSLPIHPQLADSEAHRVIDVCRSVVGRANRLQSLVVPVYRNAASIHRPGGCGRAVSPAAVDAELEAAFVIDGSPDDSRVQLLRSSSQSARFASRVIDHTRELRGVAAIRIGMSLDAGHSRL